MLGEKREKKKEKEGGKGERGVGEEEMNKTWTLTSWASQTNAVILSPGDTSQSLRKLVKISAVQALYPEILISLVKGKAWASVFCRRSPAFFQCGGGQERLACWGEAISAQMVLIIYA